jgi:hypothetical protein
VYYRMDARCVYLVALHCSVLATVVAAPASSCDWTSQGGHALRPLARKSIERQHPPVSQTYLKNKASRIHHIQRSSLLSSSKKYFYNQMLWLYAPSNYEYGRGVFHSTVLWAEGRILWSIKARFEIQ